MSPADWNRIGRLSGDDIEDFAATCLRQRYDNALQVRPAQGDGGIDVYRETPDGLVVWQIKRFTAPLDDSQRRQVTNSWNRFWDSHVALGERVAQYHLATPWTPTVPARAWFTELAVNAAFSCQWDGQSFFDSLAADFPGTFAYFFRGSDFLDNMVLANAVLAGSPVEQGEPATMLEAARRRDDALREIRDMASPNYFINTGTLSTRDGTPPLPRRQDAGVFHRYEYLGSNRYRVESVVPRSRQSTEIDPIRLEIQFQVEPGSAEAEKLDDWRFWGVPFSDIPAVTRQVGGPFHEDDPSSGVLSFLLAPQDHSYPGIELRPVVPSDHFSRALRFSPAEVTHGIDGGGTRVVAFSTSGTIRLELRGSSTLRPGAANLTLTPRVGTVPHNVRDELGLLTSIRSDDAFEFAIAGDGPTLSRGVGLGIPKSALTILQVATDLADLQGHSTSRFVMPDVTEVTRAQLEGLHRVAEIFRGNPFVTTWDSVVLTITNPDGIDPLLDPEGGTMVKSEEPIIRLGTAEYSITSEIVYQYMTATLGTPIDRAALNIGDELELRPAGDSRLIVTKLRDDG